MTDKNNNRNKQSIRILIAEDSRVVASILKALFNAEDDLDVVGIAVDGAEAVRMTDQLKPDLITMDVMMPVMDGVEATERIMEETPTPIVVISSHVNDGEMKVTFRSLAAGALSVLEKPEDVLSPEFELRRISFLKTIRAMAGVKVVRRSTRRRKIPVDVSPQPALPNKGAYRLLALGASTGGPNALNLILKELPAEFPLPIIIAQHITREFTKGMLDWMNDNSALNLKIAEDGELALPGNIYFAPDGTDISVLNVGDKIGLTISPIKPEGVLTPNISVLFGSIAASMAEESICGILTGMGSDGADGLLQARKQGAWTFAEAEETCVVYGMPQAAAEIDAARQILPLPRISEHLLALVGLSGRG